MLGVGALHLDFKGALAVIVVLCDFALIGVDMVLRGGNAPDAVIASFASGSMLLVLGFYFGSHNGQVAQAAQNAAESAARASTILALAQQRRHRDPAEEPAA
jgi:gamma-glutamyltranspeptidase